MRNGLKILLSAAVLAAMTLTGADILPGTMPLQMEGDISVRMVEGIDRYLMRALGSSVEARPQFWHRDFSSTEAYGKSVETNRVRLRAVLGMEAQGLRRGSVNFEWIGELKTNRYESFQAVRWRVSDGVFGEGLVYLPPPPAKGWAVAIPDADQTPEMLAGLTAGIPAGSQFARKLAAQGLVVLVPALLDRSDTFSGNTGLQKFTNQPHREWIYRQSYEMGRHVIGYEVEMILAGADALEWHTGIKSGGVIGYGEGGLLALEAAALDQRITSTVVSGYFDRRERIWEEPIYRNVWGYLREFGDAEVASLIAPRRLVIEHSEGPQVSGPPAARAGRKGAAPGKLSTPEFNSIETEAGRARDLVRGLPGGEWLTLVHGNEGNPVSVGSDATLAGLLKPLGVEFQPEKVGKESPATTPGDLIRRGERQSRLVAQWEGMTQRLLGTSEQVRRRRVGNHFFSGRKEWDEFCRTNRAYFWEEVMGKLPREYLPPNPRSRQIMERPKWTGFEVALDVAPDVFAWGYLLLPKDLKPGERRPVVVCQHGLEGLPEDVLNADVQSRGYGFYKEFGARLADQGFVVFVPHNPYRGGDKFRVLQRKANPLKLSLFSFIIAQHDVLTAWLAQQPFVDPARIGFYGLSYGGKTAMRVPAVLDRYALSICSGDFNEWIRKNAVVDSPYSYLFTYEYEMPEFNLGMTFNYAEMASLIAPRPFMVERGHRDGVAPDEWVLYEFAKVQKHYEQLDLAKRTELDLFDGPHTIHGVATFRFLHEHLRWPEGR